MVDLAERGAFAGLDLPAHGGGVTLTALPEAPMLALTPFRGRAEAAGAALGAALPGPGGTAALADGSRLIWAGLDAWLLRGPAATEALAERLAGEAAATDVSDGWAVLALTGRGAAEVLARLAPVDLDARAFPPGRAARTELRHVPCLIVAREGGVEVFVPRSYAATAAHELAAAMRAVAAREQVRAAEGARCG